MIGIKSEMSKLVAMLMENKVAYSTFFKKGYGEVVIPLATSEIIISEVPAGPLAIKRRKGMMCIMDPSRYSADEVLEAIERMR